MERKFKLANLILISLEELKKTDSVKDGAAINQELTHDAKELAELILEEDKEQKIA